MIVTRENLYKYNLAGHAILVLLVSIVGLASVFG